MKKNLLLTTVLCLFGIVLFAQTPTVIAQWSFATGVDTIDKYPSPCITLNAKSALFAQDTTAWPNTILRPINYTNGITTMAATATHWQDGKDSKQWNIKFKTNYAKNITISSKQRSGGATPGPKYWKVQAQISGQSWVDLGTVTVANEWTTGVLTDVALPKAFDSISKNVFIRWIMVSDSSTAATIVDSNGVSKIDDIIVKGIYPTVGINNEQTTAKVSYYPNPNNSGILYVENKDVTVNNIIIFNTQGQIQINITNPKGINYIDVQNLLPGLYFIRTEIDGSIKPAIQKLIVQ